MKSDSKAERQPGNSRFDSLGWRIFFWTAILALGPLLIMSYQGFHCARQAIDESVGDHLVAVLEVRQIQLESLITGVRNDFELMAITPCTTGICSGLGCSSSHAVQDEENTNCCGFLDNLREKNPVYDQIIAFNQDWLPLNSTTGAEGLSREFLPPDFLQDRSGAEEMVITPVQLLPDGRLIGFAGRTYVGSDGYTSGYITARLDLTREVGLLLGQRGGLDIAGRMMLVKSDGDWLFTSTGVEPVNSFSTDLLSNTSSHSDSPASRYANSHGQDVLGVSLNVPSFGWLLVAEVDHSEAFSWLRTLRIRALITGALTFLLVIVLARRGAGRLSRPLAELAAVSRKIAGGDHGERVTGLEGTEAREVGRGFNRMMDELAESHRRLTHAASLAAVGQLSSSIVHEMRNPLSSVKLNLQALRQRVADEEPYAELSDIALDQAGRLERMLEDLLGYGKPLELKIDRVDLALLAESVMDELRAVSEPRNVTVLKQDLGGMKLNADPEQLHRVLANLMANAIQAAGDGGEVTLSAAAADTATIITVSDNGPGIDAGILDRLFHPFVSTRGEGTGLGLAYVKKIVDLHGGTVSAENLPEGGACFTVSLPA